MLVLDEPTAFLDVAGRIELTIALADLADDGLAVIVATHDLDLALSHADRVWLVNDRTVTEGSPEQLVSTGELTRVFSDGTVEVDTRTGTVRARLRAGQPIVVEGHGLDSLLVRRMATRLGATVIEPGEGDGDGDGGPWRISHDGTAWILVTHTGRHSNAGFDELSASLRAELARSPHAVARTTA